MRVSTQAEGEGEGGGVQCQRGGGLTANPSWLESVCEEVQYPVVECCPRAQSEVFLLVKIVLNAELKSTNSVLSLVFLFSRSVRTEWTCRPPHRPLHLGFHRLHLGLRRSSTRLLLQAKERRAALGAAFFFFNETHHTQAFVCMSA